MNDDRIVVFDQYCPTCKYKTREEYEDPCNDCLTNPVNTDSKKPVNYISETS